MTHSFEQAMAAFRPALPLAVALSGGADSSALLLACAERWPGQVCAIHVNHGLQQAAGAFEAHCEALCQRLNVPLAVQPVAAGAAPGQSPEEAARSARYKAFEALALDGIGLIAIQSIALAQHADDQVETLLLALSRGAGLPGLAAMPGHWQRAGIDWY
ncbi:MAG: tRNA lysidine(34) synthetase TilS, partial [Giesbergeria sp.]